jgi:hypothetical protein
VLGLGRRRRVRPFGGVGQRRKADVTPASRTFDRSRGRRRQRAWHAVTRATRVNWHDPKRSLTRLRSPKGNVGSAAGARTTAAGAEGEQPPWLVRTGCGSGSSRCCEAGVSVPVVGLVGGRRRQRRAVSACWRGICCTTTGTARVSDTTVPVSREASMQGGVLHRIRRSVLYGGARSAGKWFA